MNQLPVSHVIPDEEIGPLKTAVIALNTAQEAVLLLGKHAEGERSVSYRAIDAQIMDVLFNLLHTATRPVSADGPLGY